MKYVVNIVRGLSLVGLTMQHPQHRKILLKAGCTVRLAKHTRKARQLLIGTRKTTHPI
jgi:hypothetical protein